MELMMTTNNDDDENEVDREGLEKNVTHEQSAEEWKNERRKTEAKV